MNPDFKAGMRAFDQGEPYDPAQRGQWRRGWETARDNDALARWRKINPAITDTWDTERYRK